MALDIRGSLKNTRINKKPFVFIDELLANTIDSYLIRNNQDPSLTESLKVDFVITFYKTKLLGDDDEIIFGISCEDNGAGFDDEQVKAFTTKDTSYKDDLAIGGIGKCRGLGRIQFLHYFTKVHVESIYCSGGKTYRRTLSIDSLATKEVEEKSFIRVDADGQKIYTRLVLDGMKPDVYERLFKGKNMREEFSADSLKQHVMVNFLQRFVSLKDTLKIFQITFKTVYEQEVEQVTLGPADLPQITTSKTVNIFYQDVDGNNLPKSETFTISHYKLDKSVFNLKANLIALCAKSASVKAITHKYLKTKTLEKSEIGGFYHILLIESDYLNEHVNGQRDDFDIPADTQQMNLFMKDLISLDQIYESIEDIVDSMVSPPDWDRDKIIKSISQKYGITGNMISESKVRIIYGDTEERVVKRVMGAYQDKVIKATSDIFDIKIEIAKTDPTTAEFRDKINDLAWKYTSSLRDIDMMNLSQLVVRRAAILEILSMAIDKALPAQSKYAKRCDEKFIHNILFPMGTDSKETKNHDIWLLNEEYQYFDYISSDRALSTLTLNGGGTLFDSTIDAEFQAVLDRIYQGNAAKRPDIAIFSKEGSVIIIELKSPGISLDEHADDLMEYATLLAAKSKGKLSRFYGYLLGDTINPNRLRGYTRFPSNNGWFATDTVKEHSTDRRLGQLYSEILYYKDIVDRAGKRLEEYKRRLGVRLR